MCPMPFHEGIMEVTESQSCPGSSQGDLFAGFPGQDPGAVSQTVNISAMDILIKIIKGIIEPVLKSWNQFDGDEGQQDKAY